MMRRFVVLFFVVLSFVANSQNVKRIVSLAPSVTDNIYLIGGEKKLVGCTSYCLPAIEDGIPQVGTAVEVNVEKVFSLSPDLVITTQLIKPQDIASLRKLGIRVEVLETPRSFQQICNQTMQIAALIGETENADKIVNEAKLQVGEIRRKSKSMKRKKVFFQIGANPVFTVIGNTYLNDYITFCNAENISESFKVGTISREAVIAKNPDVIVIAEMGGYGSEEQKVWFNCSNISAVENKKVFLISSSTSCNPSPVNFASALNDVYNFLNE